MTVRTASPPATVVDEDLQFHPAAEIVPPLPDVELAQLADHFRRLGSAPKFLRAGRLIIDNRDRVLACKMAGLPLQFEQWDGFGSPAELAARLNIPPHLNESQRACSAVLIAQQLAREHGLPQRPRDEKGAFLEKKPTSANLHSWLDAPGGVYRGIVQTAIAIAGAHRRSFFYAEQMSRESADLFGKVHGGKLNLNQARLKQSKNLAVRKLANVNGDARGYNHDSADCQVTVGDCLKIMPKMKDKSFPLIFADPPYNQGEHYDADPTRDKLPVDKYLAWCEQWMRHCARLLTSDGSLFVMISTRYAGRFDVLLRNLGLHWRAMITWHGNFPEHTRANFQPAARIIHYFTRSPSKFIFNDDLIRMPSRRDQIEDARRVSEKGIVPHDVWQIPWEIPCVTGNSKERVPFDDMPPQLPQKLLTRIVLAASNPGDRVFDPFTGNGTTWRACGEHNRKFTGIERSEKYAAQARRWAPSLPEGGKS